MKSNHRMVIFGGSGSAAVWRTAHRQRIIVAACAGELPVGGRIDADAAVAITSALSGALGAHVKLLLKDESDAEVSS